VKEIWHKDSDHIATLLDGERRTYFHRGLTQEVLNKVFFVLRDVIDLDKIFESPACELYCTTFANLCAYVLKYRVNIGTKKRSDRDNKKVCTALKDCPKEARFQNIRVQDLPRAASLRTDKRRRQDRPLVPLSDRDPDFRFFGAPPGFMPPVNGSSAGVVPSPGQTGVTTNGTTRDTTIEAAATTRDPTDGGDE
jgi:hypothetical protein